MSSPRRVVGVLLVVLSLPSLSFRSLEAAAAQDTPAHRAALRFMRGINFGNYLEYIPGSPAANASYTLRDFTLAREEGFDHIRLPVAWSLYTGPGPEFEIAQEIFNKADAMVANALNSGLAVIVDLHHFYDLNGDPAAHTDEFHAIWRQVAAHYAGAPADVAFELVNEPHGAATTAVMNRIYTHAIRNIREANPDRTIFVGPGSYNSLDEISRLSLPADDLNLIVAVHCYDPYYFTHQGAEWAYPDTLTTGVVFPGPPPVPLKPDPSITHDWVIDWFRDYSQLPAARNPSSPIAFRSRLQRAKAWSDANGRPVHVGEFGCYSKADGQSRVNFYRAIRETMDELGLGWAMWDWKSGFHYVVNGRPEPAGLREALFPPITLTAVGKGTITAQASVGKTFVVERASSLAPLSWTPISTQTLSSTTFRFTDAGASAARAYYRVRWAK